jgi:hypothetical protein
VTRADAGGRGRSGGIPARGPADGRAQANLPALAVALLVVTTGAGLAFGLADGAFASAERDAAERRTAVALAERLVAPGSPLTDRANVVNRTAARRFDGADLAALSGVGDHAVRVRLADRTLAARGTPTGGVTVRRVVLVANRTSVTYRPRLRDDRITLPRRTPRVRLRLDPPPATRLRTVRANGRVVLRDPAGLRGRFTVRVSRFETTRLAFDATGPLPPGSVVVTYAPARTTKAVLEVTVGD